MVIKKKKQVQLCLNPAGMGSAVVSYNWEAQSVPQMSIAIIWRN